MQIEEILKALNLKAFDFWRILNSFIKFDPTMPRTLSVHFRELETRIASETAWQKDSPVIEIIKELTRK